MDETLTWTEMVHERISMSITLNCTSAVRAMRKFLILSSDGDNSGNKKCEWSYGADYGGSSGVYMWTESGVRRLTLCWCVWHEPGFSRQKCFHI